MGVSEIQVCLQGDDGRQRQENHQKVIGLGTWLTQWENSLCLKMRSMDTHTHGISGLRLTDRRWLWNMSPSLSCTPRVSFYYCPGSGRKGKPSLSEDFHADQSHESLLERCVDFWAPEGYKWKLQDISFVGLSYFGGVIFIDKSWRNTCQPLSGKV